jgi:hypothetical protein
MLRKTSSIVAALSIGVLFLISSALAAESEPEDRPADGVPMAEIWIKDQPIRGRIVLETETSLRIDPPGRSPMAYPLDSLQKINRFTLPAHEYHEEVGDAWRDRAWDAADPPEAFIKARRAYRRAIEHAPAEEQEERLRAKLEGVAAEREEWHQEALKEEELRKAAHEAEAARISKELAKEELASVRRQEEVLKEVRDSFEQTGERLRRLEEFARDVSGEIEDLEEDIDRLYDRDRAFVRTTVFLDLRRNYRDLEDRLERLETMLSE